MIDFIGKKYYFFTLSIAIILAGVVFLFVNGLQLDIQFKGGSIMNIQVNDGTYGSDKAKTVSEKAQAVVKSTLGEDVTPQVSQTLNSKNGNKKMDMLTISMAEAMTGEQQNKLVAALEGEKGCNIKESPEIQVQNVQPLIGQELRNQGIKAALFACILIIVYVGWRFRVMSGWSAGVMAVLALVHDALIMFSVYVIFKIPLNDAFIAAVLTILGYSMNDTIIIYDRIRENSNLLRKMPIAELANRSITQTLTRSINTVVTVLICVVTLFIFARVNNIKSVYDFAFPLIVGITSGCYSSIFIASPLWVMWKERTAKKKVAAKPAKA